MDPSGLDSSEAAFSDIDPADKEYLDDMLGTQIDHTRPGLDAHEMGVDDCTPEPALSAEGTPIPVDKGLERSQRFLKPLYVRPSTIPKDAEIIDLDSYECKNPSVYSSSFALRFKVEEGIPSNADTEVQGQATSPDRSGNGINAGGGPSDVTMLDDDEGIQEVKQEPIDYQPTQDMTFGWREMSKEIFEISDDDDEVVVTKEIIGQSPSSIFGPHINGPSLRALTPVGIPRNITTPKNTYPTERTPDGTYSNEGPMAGDVAETGTAGQSTDILGVSRTYLRTPKPKLNDAQIAKFEQCQKILAERATGRPVTSGAGGIFRHSHVISPDGPSPKRTRKDDRGIPDENDHRWMEEVSSSSDEDDAAYILIIPAEGFLVQKLM